MITPNTASNFISLINQNYPVSGQDNSSQGFRDNFKNIKQSLSWLDSDVYDLRIYSLKSSENNNFNDNIIERATFKDCATYVYDETDTSRVGDIEINFENGNYQKIKLSNGHHIFTFVNWPVLSKTGKLTLQLISDNINGSTVEFASEIVKNFGTEQFPITISSTTPKIFEIWNDGDDGTIFFQTARDVVDQPRIVTFKSTEQTTTTSVANDLKGMIYANSNKLYVSYADFSLTTVTSWLSISADHVAKQLVDGSTAVTVTVTNTSTAIATTEFVKNKLDNYQFMPSGTIVLWYGSIATIPIGWNLCDGTNNTPDLRGRFVIAAGDRAEDPTVGLTNAYSTSTSAAGDHSHGGITGNSDVPNTGWPTAGTVPSTGDGGTLIVGSGNTESVETFESIAETNGTGGTHNHAISASGNHTHTYLPPYHALCYIMKL